MHTEMWINSHAVGKLGVWHMLIILGFKTLRQGDYNEFSLGYIVRPCLEEEKVIKENSFLSPPRLS